jgi:hypothetical protein
MERAGGVADPALQRRLASPAQMRRRLEEAAEPAECVRAASDPCRQRTIVLGGGQFGGWESRRS